jgi:hypothetical protein
MTNLINSVMLFTVFFILIYISKPDIFFDYDGNIRPLHFNGRQVNSIITLHTFTIFLAVISHLLASRLN